VPQFDKYLLRCHAGLGEWRRQDPWLSTRNAPSTVARRTTASMRR